MVGLTIAGLTVGLALELIPAPSLFFTRLTFGLALELIPAPSLLLDFSPFTTVAWLTSGWALDLARTAHSLFLDGSPLFPPCLFKLLSVLDERICKVLGLLVVLPEMTVVREGVRQAPSKVCSHAPNI